MPKTDLVAAENARKERLEFVRSSTVLAYEKVGRKDLRWDADVREALEAIAQVWSKYTYNDAVLLKCQAAIDRAVAAGCDDPLLLYVRGRISQGPPAQREKLHAESIAKVALADYAPERKANFYLRYAETIAAVAGENPTATTRAEMQKWSDEALKQLVLSESNASANPPLLAELNYDTGQELAKFWVKHLGADAETAIEKIFRALNQAAPRSPVAHMIKGDAYINYAWAARGDGYANTVTPEGWRLMAERLEVSAVEFEKAWSLLPTSKTAELMVNLELGRNTGRANMERWFKRAMELNPNNSSVCDSKMYYLEPKWHGSAEEMLEFGRECLATDNWASRIPLQLVAAHVRLMRHSRQNENYYKNPGVWSDIKAVYDRCLEVDPDSTFDRSYLAYYACYCDQPKIAHQQFQLLGDKVSLEPFGNKKRMQAFRAEAEHRAQQ